MCQYTYEHNIEHNHRRSDDLEFIALYKPPKRSILGGLKYLCARTHHDPNPLTQALHNTLSRPIYLFSNPCGLMLQINRGQVF
mmetsp:Transcript_10980/g.21300  ORF Transcript_10980/g.21300 Transcript_10980/m.21300 type:complete len:83 (+) Transcript_10980:1431-1679(+)